MTEKTERIAELEREIERCENMVAWHPNDWEARDKVTNLRAELARLRNESPALTQGEGSEPVGWRADVNNAPRDGTKLDLWRANKHGESRVINCQWYNNKWVFNGGCNTIGERDVILFWRLADTPRTHYPPLPAGNADPRVREAPESARQAVRKWQRHHLLREYGGNGLVLPENLELSKHLDTLLSALPSPQSQGLVDAAEWQPIETAPQNEEIIIGLYDERFIDPVIQNSMQVDKEERGWVWIDWHGYPPPTHWMRIPKAPIKLDDRSRASDRSA